MNFEIKSIHKTYNVKNDTSNYGNFYYKRVCNGFNIPKATYILL